MSKPKQKIGNIDFVLFATLMLLVAIGIVMVYSSSSYVAYFDPTTHDSMFYLKKQILWFALGFGFMIVAINFDYHKLKKFTLALMILSVILLLVVLKSKTVNGASRWIVIGPINIQPSEIAKYVIVLYMAQSLANKGEKVKTFLYGILPYLIVSGLFAGLVLAEKNLSIASVIMIVTLIVLFVAGVKMWHMTGLILGVGAFGTAFTFLESYRLKRLMNFMNPWSDPQGSGYQLIQSLLALGSGGITGVGLGQSRQKCYYIPEPYSDFIFSIIGEELGLIGCVLIIILFLIFIWRGIRVATKAKDTFGTLLATGITSVIAIQAIINIAVVTGSMPVTGVPLPFISYGGSSLIINLVAAGILLNISRQSQNKA